VSDTEFQDPSEGPVDEGTDTNGGGESNKFRQLREKAQRVDEAEAQLLAVNRRIAVLESGVDLETPMGALFVRAYQKANPGELTVEALREEAAKYGVPVKE
jgi:hypothetical protein